MLQQQPMRRRRRRRGDGDGGAVNNINGADGGVWHTHTRTRTRARVTTSDVQMVYSCRRRRRRRQRQRRRRRTTRDTTGTTAVGQVMARAVMRFDSAPAGNCSDVHYACPQRPSSTTTGPAATITAAATRVAP